MNETLSAAALASGLLTTDLTPVLVTGAVFGSITVIVGMALYAGFRYRRMRHDTIRLALEKGQPIPAELVQEGERVDARRDLRRGVNLVALGLGLGLFLLVLQPEEGVWAVAFVPVLLGAGYLLTYALTRPRPGADAPRG